MDVALRIAVPVGLVRRLDAPGHYALVVKLTYDIEGGGLARIADSQRPLSKGAIAMNGLVLEPSDFASIKTACDVIVAGSSLPRAGPVRVGVGSLDSIMTAATSVATQDGGCAPREQRMPFPRLPLELGVGHAGRFLVATLPAPQPEAVVIPWDKTKPLSAIVLRIDTIAVHPWRDSVSVVFRGSFAHDGDVDEDLLVAVDATGSLQGMPARLIAKWPRRRAWEASDPDDEVDEAPTPPPRSGELQRSSTMIMQPLPPLVPQPTLDMIVDPQAPLVPQPTLDMPAAEPLRFEYAAQPTLQIELVAEDLVEGPLSEPGLDPQPTLVLMTMSSSLEAPMEQRDAQAPSRQDTIVVPVPMTAPGERNRDGTPET